MWLQLQKTKRRGELAKCDLYFLFYEKHLTVFHNFLALLGRQKVLLLKTCLVKQCNVPLLETTYLNEFGHGSHLRQATNKLGKKRKEIPRFIMHISKLSLSSEWNFVAVTIDDA